MSPAEDGALRVLLPLVLQYMKEFPKSELLARKLAYICARKLAFICSSSGSLCAPSGGSGAAGSGGVGAATGPQGLPSELPAPSPLLNSVSPHSPMVNGNNSNSNHAL